MAAICGIVTAAIFQLLIGLVSTAFAGYTVAYSSYQGDSENDILLISFQSNGELFCSIQLRENSGVFGSFRWINL